MNVFKSIWNNKKVKTVQRKMRELDKKHDQLSRELEHAKTQALHEHKRKSKLKDFAGHKKRHAKTRHHSRRRRYY